MSVTTETGSSWNLNKIGTYARSTTKTADKADATTKTEDEKKTDIAIKGLGDNFTHFLKLLTTQMQNQDPLKPMDTNDMTNQLVQFANVEQNIGTNSRLDKMLKIQQTNSAASNLSYLGRIVEYEGEKFPFVQGMEKAPLQYELETSAKAVRINIMDDKGRIVRSVAGETGAGKLHKYDWDFKDDQGRLVQPGTYKFSIAPTSEKKDEIIKTHTTTYGVVQSVDFSKDGEPLLAMTTDNITVPISKAKKVH